MNSTLNCQPIEVIGSCELYELKLLLPFNYSVIVIGAYRPPNRDLS